VTSKTDWGISELKHFTMILDENGAPWMHGNLYLLYKATIGKPVEPSTIESIAKDLTKVMNILHSTGRDYLTFGHKPYQRPTYYVASELEAQVQQGIIGKRTKNRIVNRMTGLYRWMIPRHDFNPTVELWREHRTSISYSDSRGFSRHKDIITTDLTTACASENHDFSDYILDGGRLMPLNKNDQQLLIQALISIGNPEMLLSFLIALTTGARIQTVFTLPTEILGSGLMNSDDLLKIKVGYGRATDTKYSKRMTLLLPGWLHNLLLRYVDSDRYAHRKSMFHGSNGHGDYIFITRTGKPYYMSKREQSLNSERRPPTGQSVRQFISNRLAPELIKMGAQTVPRFHDLRATFGMNLVEEKMPLINQGKASYYAVLNHLKLRLGHESSKTTEGYLTYKTTSLVKFHAQSRFEKHIEQLVTSRTGMVWNEN